MLNQQPTLRTNSILGRLQRFEQPIARFLLTRWPFFWGKIEKGDQIRRQRQRDITRFISSHRAHAIVTEGFLNVNLHPSLTTSVRAWQFNIASTCTSFSKAYCP